MLRKVILILSAGFIIRLLSACCSCDSGIDTEVIFTDVAVTLWNTAGFQPQPLTGKADRDAFGMTLDVGFTEKDLVAGLDIGVFGFGQAMACDCDVGIRMYTDPIDQIQITVTDTVSRAILVVTDDFSISRYNPVIDAEESVTLSEYFKDQSDEQSFFSIDLTNDERIPDHAIFTVNVQLVSGKILTDTNLRVDFNP